jgi:hypothetical protein
LCGVHITSFDGEKDEDVSYDDDIGRDLDDFMHPTGTRSD